MQRGGGPIKCNRNKKKTREKMPRFGGGRSRIGCVGVSHVGVDIKYARHEIREKSLEEDKEAHIAKTNRTTRATVSHMDVKNGIHATNRIREIRGKS